MASGHDVFISHAGEDKDFLAQPIYDGLRRLGMRGFLDRSELEVGGDAQDDMIYAMETAPIGLFLLSPEFVMKKWPNKELFCFHRRRSEAPSGSGQGNGIVPVLIPVFYRLTVAETRYGDLFDTYAEIAIQNRFYVRAQRGEAEANIKEVSDSLKKLAGYTGIENTERATNECTEEAKKKRDELVKRICEKVGQVMANLFPVPCNVPENSEEVRLDFEGAGSEGEGGSYEWSLLQELVREDVGRKRRIVCVKGGAGGGKSCILRGVGRRDELTFRFRGGIYYMSLGYDATMETLAGELLKTLRACGEGRCAEELSNESRLDVIIDKVRDAMRGKKSLVLIDDLWQRNRLGPGTVDKVRQVVGSDSGGVVVVTTRDTAVALKGEVLDIKPRGVVSVEAKRILLGHAKLSVDKITEGFHGVFDELLRLCGGLPLCLAIMGRGLAELILNAGCMKVEVWERYLGMMKKGERLVFGKVDDYENVWTTLSIALKVLEERRGPYEGSSRGLSWRQMHRSFCAIKKQTTVRLSVVARVWGLESEDEALFVLNAFCSVGLADIVMGSEGRTSGVVLHDLVHDFCVACAKKEGEVLKWHGVILEGYRRGGAGRGGLEKWWKMEEDGYIYENVSRHLRGSGNGDELVELVLNVGWVKARLKYGGLLAWKADFVECAEGIEGSWKYGRIEKEELEKGLFLVLGSVVESWPFLSENEGELGFQVFWRLWGIRNWAVRKFLESVEAGQERPWVKGIGRWWDRPGRRGRGGEFVLRDEVWAIAVDDKRQVAVAGAGRDVVFIDMEGMEVVRTCKGHERMVGSVSLSSDGSRAYSWSYDGVLREWEVETGEEVGCVSLKNDGGNDSDASDFLCAAICAQRNFVVTGSARGTIEVWDIESGERRGGAMDGFDGAVWCVSVSRDGRRIVAGGGDGTLRAWDESTSAQVGAVMRGHEHEVYCAAFSPDGQLVASGSIDGTIRVWEVESGTQRGDTIRGHVGWIRCVCFSEDGQRIISGGDDRTVRIWDAATGAQVGRSFLGRTDWVLCVSITRDGRFVVSGGRERTVRVWDLAAASDEAEETPEDANDVRCVDVSVDGRWFVSGSRDGTVRVYDGSSGKQVGDALQAHDDVVSCVEVSPCGRRFVSGSYDKTLCVWDVETRAQVGEPLRGHTFWVVCVAYSPNGDFIVSGSLDKTVRVWDTVTHAQIGGPIGGGSEARTEWPMSTAEAVVEGEASSSGSEGSSDEDSGDKSTVTHTHWVTCVRVSEDGGRIVCGLDDGGLYVWDVTSRNLVGGRRSQHSIRIKRLDMLAGNVVRSVDMFGDEKRWRLDGEDGLVRLEGTDECVQGAEGTSAEGCATRNEVICVGREVRVRGSNVKLATLPASVYEQQWCFSEVHGTLGVVLEDGRLRFLHVK